MFQRNDASSLLRPGVDVFRTAHNITEEMESTGEYGVCWKRLR